MSRKKWVSSNFKGVRYYEHPTRKHGKKRDKYLAIRYQQDGVRKEEGIGWTSKRDPEDNQYWTEAKAALVLERLRGAARQGKKEAPTRISEQREIERQRKEAEREAQEKAKKESVSFGHFFNDTYLPQAKAEKKASSIEREEALYRKWISPILSERPLKDIVPLHLEKLKKKMADAGQSVRSIEYALAVVRQIFNAARRYGTFNGENPTAKVKFPKPDNGRMRFLTHDEADRLLAELAKKSADVHDITLLSLHCGLRFGEIASLTWADVDPAKGILTIRDAKAGSRYAFLTEQAADMLKNRERGNPSDYVFQKRKKEGGKIEKISNVFGRAVDTLKLNKGIDDPRLKICFHSCRHSHASWLIDAGTDLYTVQKLLGHKTSIMTQRYAHLSEHKLKGAAVALGKALKKTKRKDTSEKVVNLNNKRG